MADNSQPRINYAVVPLERMEQVQVGDLVTTHVGQFIHVSDCAIYGVGEVLANERANCYPINEPQDECYNRAACRSILPKHLSRIILLRQNPPTILVGKNLLEVLAKTAASAGSCPHGCDHAERR